jgi:hypothetical protein
LHPQGLGSRQGLHARQCGLVRIGRQLRELDQPPA